jgi:hypothetical protein
MCNTYLHNTTHFPPNIYMKDVQHIHKLHYKFSTNIKSTIVVHNPKLGHLCVFIFTTSNQSPSLFKIPTHPPNYGLDFRWDYGLHFQLDPLIHHEKEVLVIFSFDYFIYRTIPHILSFQKIHLKKL